MLLSTSSLALGTLAFAMASMASPVDELASLVERGSPEKTACHNKCGPVTEYVSKEGFCDEDSWKQLYNGCLDCALEHNIWGIYGKMVEDAAAKCNLVATPRPAKQAAQSPGQSSDQSAIAASNVPAPHHHGASSSVDSPAAASDVTAATAAVHGADNKKPCVAQHNSSTSAANDTASVSPPAPAKLKDSAAAPNSSVKNAMPVPAGASRNLLSGVAVTGAVALIAAAFC